MGIAGKASAVISAVKTGSKDHISSIMNVVSGIAVSPPHIVTIILANRPKHSKHLQVPVSIYKMHGWDLHFQYNRASRLMVWL